jgi:hypothetical protein
MRLEVRDWGETAGWAIINLDAEPDDEAREGGGYWYLLHAYNFPSEREARIWVRVFELAFAIGVPLRWADYHERFVGYRLFKR